MKNNNDVLPKNLICFSHLRWDFVYQRPQHLLTRFARNTKVSFFEEAIFDAQETPYLSSTKKANNLYVVVPHLCGGMSAEEINNSLSMLLDQLVADVDMDDCIFWYYTPMALLFTDKFKPKLIIYDCMDELSAFKFAPEQMISLEKKLISKSDLIFTGGQSLYEEKKKQHSNIFPFPSSIDKNHFKKSRTIQEEPGDQRHIGGPKIGFYGVIDERFDIQLIKDIAEQRPHWQIILIGPVVKIDHHELPQHPNIHYLGQKTYTELPDYLSGWDIALIPFQLNEATQYISPTKTPEYLAAGIPVVSTPIRDVISPYGLKKLVHIGTNGSDFIAAIDKQLQNEDTSEWLHEVDHFLKNISWDKTYMLMRRQIKATLNQNNKISIAS